MTAAWGDAATAGHYRAFEARHGRYRRANEALARHAALRPGLRVLDLAAGTGGTTAALLPALGDEGRVDCVEPAQAMAEAGRERIGADPRVRWHRSLQELAPQPLHDRVVCGAAIWQWPDLGALLRQLARRLTPGGALVFNVPAAYLGEPDGPGGGSDPYLTDLLERLGPPPANATAAAPLPTPGQITTMLREAGLTPRPWRHRQRLTQAAWRDWHKIPVLTDLRWPGLPAAERARRIDAAATGLDMSSWRPEAWLGWTAWRPAFEHEALPSPARGDAARVARQQGALLLRQVLPRASVLALRRVVQAAGRQHGLLDGHHHWAAGRAAAPHDMPAWLALQNTVALSEAFQALAAGGPLQRAVQAALGQAVQPHGGSVVRIAAPEHLVPATPPHRDADYLGDASSTWTAWLPLHDCGAAEGALAVAPGSHTAAGARQAPRWRTADLAEGDVLLFHARTLHRAHPNQRLQAVRLSADFRFHTL